MTVTGGYFAISEFLFLLETLPRAKAMAVTGTSTEDDEQAHSSSR